MPTPLQRFLSKALLYGSVICAGGPALAEMGDLVADSAYGQSDLFHSIGLPIGTATFAEPRGVAIDRNTTPNRAYVSDAYYSRVLGWNDVDAMVSGAPADLVIGQPDFFSFGCNGDPAVTSSRPPATLSNLCRPQGIDVGPDGSLYVTDRDNCRLLVYFDPFATDATADIVLGACGPTGPDTFYYPLGVAVDDNGNVFVADRINRRVLEFDGPLTSTDLVPDRVFLQPDFVSGFVDGTHFPTDVAIDNDGVLYVGTGSKLLRFDDPFNDSSISATFGTDGCNTEGCSSSGCLIDGESAETTCMPQGVALGPGGTLYVGDAGNNRVLAFDQPRTSPQPSRVYGQPDFGGESGLFNDECNDGGPSATSLCTFVTIRLTLGGTFQVGVGVDLDAAGRLYVADTLNHRVLRYDDPVADSVADVVLGHVAMDDIRRPLPTIEGPYVAMMSSQLVAVDSEQSRLLLYGSTNVSTPTPMGVIGQPDFGTTGCNSGGLSASSLCAPTAAVAESYGPLWVADTGNNRVLRFDRPWFEYDYEERKYIIKKVADAVYGQPDFTSNACGAGTDGLCAPRGLAKDLSQNLYVSDADNNRIVRYNDPLADATADIVIGQPDFSSTSCNTGGRSADSLCDPRGIRIYYGTGDMFVADHGNNRVLIYEQVEQFPGGAETVFGQAGSFTTGACSGGAGGLCQPSDVDRDRAGQILVADSGNHRVVQYNLPFSDTDADRVFGQPDLDANTCNNGGVSDVSLCSPVSLGLYRSFGDKLFIGDAGNQRIVKIDAPYCAEEYFLADKVAGGDDASGPWKTKLKVRRGTPGKHRLKFGGKIMLWESDGFADFHEEPLITLSTSSGIEYRERVPWTDCTFRGETEKCKTVWLKGERDGIDDYKMTDRFRFNPRQHSKVGWRGRAVALDLSSFTEPQARLQLQFGSVCFSSDLQCVHKTNKTKCQP
jgi:sugar lactone lactonase YvrE